MRNLHIERSENIPLLLEWRMRVLDEVFAHWKAHTDYEGLRQANLEYYHRHIDKGTNVSCFAMRGEEIVGCGALCLQEEMPSPDNPSGRVGYLMNIYVVPAMRGQGAGSDIVRWLQEEAGERGITKLMLETTPAGHNVYAQLGFKSAEGYMIAHREPDIH